MCFSKRIPNMVVIQTHAFLSGAFQDKPIPVAQWWNSPIEDQLSKKSNPKLQYTYVTYVLYIDCSVQMLGRYVKENRKKMNFYQDIAILSYLTTKTYFLMH